MTGIIPLFGGIPGGPEMLVILLIAILLFGANKIPKLARSTGEAMGEFKKGREEIEEELNEVTEPESNTAGSTDTVDLDENDVETADDTTANN